MMGEVIVFPLRHLTFRMYDKKEELIFSQKLRCPECNNLKEDDWFITYKDQTFISLYPYVESMTNDLANFISYGFFGNSSEKN